ncbi:hypothetical protein Taro_040085 [Colocasia esculenta]|uniref:MACPF domain-containing protein n=1 Tax=Colocasia esculenta TaxID=4460 RepID=A0A843WI60_COLES|nr:hypothetical protein [Colocasia esculenta]
MPALEPRLMTPQEAAERAVRALGCGYDLADDIRLSACKRGPAGAGLVRLPGGGAGDLVLPCGVAVRDVPGAVRCDKGERTHFRSDVLSFHQMAEQFNQNLSLSGKIPSGLFNAMFDFRGCWQKDATRTKSLSFDGWFITLYSVELERTRIALDDLVIQDVPSSWDPAALAKFIEKYGTHVIAGVKMGAKDVIHIKQQYGSALTQSEVQNLLKRCADKCFSEDCNESSFRDLEPGGKSKSKQLAQWEYGPVWRPVRSPIILKDKLVNSCQQSVPFIVPLCSICRYYGFCNNADKPRMEDLHHFLEFQIPRKWAPVFSDLPLSLQLRRHGFPSLQFIFMGPKLSVNTILVESGNRPVTGIRLYLEGKKNDCLAIHLQHLSELPSIVQLSGDSSYDDITLQSREYHEPIKWAFLSHVCTAPVQYTGVQIDDFAYIVTKAWLEVKELSLRKVLFLRLGFSAVASAKIRNSQWTGPASTTRTSGSISALISTRFGMGQNPPADAPKVHLNSAVFPSGPPVPAKAPRMSSIVDTTEMVRGPEESPGYWVVTGAKLCVEGGKISLRAKYSLLAFLTEDDI